MTNDSAWMEFLGRVFRGNAPKLMLYIFLLPYTASLNWYMYCAALSIFGGIAYITGELWPLSYGILACAVSLLIVNASVFMNYPKN